MNWPKKLWLKLQAPWLANTVLSVPAISAGTVILLNYLPALLFGNTDGIASGESFGSRYSLPGYCLLFFLFAAGMLAPLAARKLQSPELKSSSSKKSLFSPALFYRAGLLLLYVSLIPGGHFFSDDSVRHELDGNYIARGWPLYCLSPNQLGLPEGRSIVSTSVDSHRYDGRFLTDTGTESTSHSRARTNSYHLVDPPDVDRLPNHPHLATIYFPGTQLLAFVATFVGGYRILFALTAILMMAYLLFSRSGNSANLSRLIGILFVHPFWMILFYSGHSDVTAILLCLVAGRLLGERFGIFRYFLVGLFWAAAVSMKPEAALFGLCILVSLSRAPGPGAGQAQRVGSFLGLTAGGLVAIGILLPFTLFDLFQLRGWSDLNGVSAQEGSSLQTECFFYTARIYSDYFLSYRPDAVFLAEQQDLNSAEAISLVRMLWLPAWLLAFPLLFVRPWCPNPGPRSAHFRSWLMRFLNRLFVYLLIGYFLYRGSWQPWYFLWFLLAPGILAPTRLVGSDGFTGGSRWPEGDSGPNNFGRYGLSFFLSLLTLFYLPVINYRVDGGFDLSFFYISFLLASAIGAMIYFTVLRSGKDQRENQ